MRRTAIWKSIAGTLTAEIADGHYAPGDKLPTEAQLAARFGVNRHTVRHALSALVDAGLIHTRRGAGAFVTQSPTEYPIGKRTRYSQSVRAAGKNPARLALSHATRRANAEEAEALGLPEGGAVHVREGLSLADSQPVGLTLAMYPAERFPDLHAQLDGLGSVTAMFAANGIPDYVRASTQLTAVAASTTQALHLQLREGDPLLRSVAIETDPEGHPIQFGTTWFAGGRITLTLSDL